MRRPDAERPIFPGNIPLRTISDERGVSPVIAVILMVAITVVLSAVLFVMVMNLIDGGGETITLSMSWDEIGDEPGNYEGSILSIMGDPPRIEKVTLVVVDDNVPGSIKLDALKTEGNYTHGSITANYYDVNNDGKLGAEDLIIIRGLSPGDSLKLTHDDAGKMASKAF